MADSFADNIVSTEDTSSAESHSFKTYADGGYAWSLWDGVFTSRRSTKTYAFSPAYMESKYGDIGAGLQWRHVYGAIGYKFGYSDFVIVPLEEYFYMYENMQIKNFNFDVRTDGFAYWVDLSYKLVCEGGTRGNFDCGEAYEILIYMDTVAGLREGDIETEQITNDMVENALYLTVDQEQAGADIAAGRGLTVSVAGGAPVDDGIAELVSLGHLYNRVSPSVSGNAITFDMQTVETALELNAAIDPAADYLLVTMYYPVYGEEGHLYDIYSEVAVMIT